MDNLTGITLFEPTDLKLSINDQQEEDEEAIEDQKRRNEVLQKQLENAFDDWSDEEDGHDEDRAQSSCSSQGEDNRHSGPLSNGMVFHNLSDISEHSPSRSGHPTSDMSKDSGAGDSPAVNGYLFSPSRSAPFKFVQTNNSNPEFTSVMGGSGDADNYQPIFKDNMETSDNFQPGFSIMDNSKHTSHDAAEAYRQAEYTSVEQLQVLYEVRLHEIKRLTNQLEAERRDAAVQKQETFRKLALLEAEKERALLSRSEANKLLVSSKEEINQLQKEVNSMKQSIGALEKKKTTSEELLEVAKIQIQELEQQIALMERCDPSKTMVKQTDILVKDLKNTHKQEVHSLQRQLDSLTKKLGKKEEECSELERKVLELQKLKDSLLVDKSDTINQLTRSLEESQAQCSQLMASNVSCENVRLQNQLEDALREKEELIQTVKNLQVEVNIMRSDLAQFESVSRLNLPGSSSSDETDSIVQMGMSTRKSMASKHNSNLNLTDITSKLKDELHRAFLNQKAKRAEIHRLQEVINNKEHQIKEMTTQERINLASTESLKQQLNSMMEEMSILQEKSKSEDSHKNKDEQTEEMISVRAKVTQLQKEKSVLEREKLEVQQKLDDLTKRFEQDKRREMADYNKEYLKFHDEMLDKVRKEVQDEAELKIKEYRLRLEQSLSEVNAVKEMYVTVCTAKEQLTQSVEESKSQLTQVTAERDQLAEELKEIKALRDQLARTLNETAANKSDNFLVQRLEEEISRLKEDLDKCTNMRDQLVVRVSSLKKDNEELTSELHRLKELMKSSPLTVENKMLEECGQLREEMAAMSARHTQELSAARAELQGARDRLVQLERCARTQFETEVKSLRQDRDMLRNKCDEKEVQIKKLIESRKRPPSTTTTASQTDGGEERGESEVMGERHRRELQRCREEYSNTLAVMEDSHHQALAAANSRHREDMERLQENHHQILERIKEQIEQQEDSLKARHVAELQQVEERTKQLTVKYFAEEVRKLEARYKQATQTADSSVVESLQKAVLEKSNEIESLRHKMAALSEEFRRQIATLQNRLEEEKSSASELMLQWSKEIKSIQGELKLKEAIIDDQRMKIEKAQGTAKKYRNKLIKTNKEITSQYMSKCAEYKAQMQENIEESKKEAFAKIKQLEQYYEEREKELKKKTSKKKYIK